MAAAQPGGPRNPWPKFHLLNPSNGPRKITGMRDFSGGTWVQTKREGRACGLLRACPKFPEQTWLRTWGSCHSSHSRVLQLSSLAIPGQPGIWTKPGFGCRLEA